MNSAKNEFPISWANIQKFNKRIPKKLEREQEDLAKKFRKPKHDPLDSLRDLYQFLDEYMSHARGLIACDKGCSHCCHMEVGLSQIEADYITRETGINASEVAFRTPTKTEGWIDASRPCPFLRSDACSIYAFRPIMCRTHMSFELTNELCQPSDDDYNRTVPQIDRKTSYPGAMKAYGELMRRYGGRIGDIREFFQSSRVGLRHSSTEVHCFKN